MKISTKGRYGLTIMMELANRVGEGPTSLKSIAEKHQLSEHYLEQLVAPLRNAGLVKSIRGAYGGYILSKSAEQVTAGEVIRVLEGPISPVDFTEEDDPAKRDLVDSYSRQYCGCARFYYTCELDFFRRRRQERQLHVLHLKVIL